MRKELNNFIKKIQKKIKKYRKNDNIPWTRKAFLRLIYFEKRNVVRQKLVKGYGNRIQPISIHKQKNNAKVITSRQNIANRRSNLMVND